MAAVARVSEVMTVYRIGKCCQLEEFEELGQVLVGMIEHGSIGRLQADEEALLVSNNAIEFAQLSFNRFQRVMNLDPFQANSKFAGVRLHQSRSASSDGVG